ncbi:hypothetical protein [Burkholderia ubonensis]|nr:hypothetical protein [Burkholderia ubonensis]
MNFEAAKKKALARVREKGLVLRTGLFEDQREGFVPRTSGTIF